MAHKDNKKHMFSLASLDGLGVVTNAIGDYSSTAASFRAVVGDNDWVEFHRVIVGIEDTAINNSAEYGGISALTNGVLCHVRDSDDSLLETLTPFPIKTNGWWALCCHDMTPHNFGNGSDFISVRWTWEKSGWPIVLSGGQYIEFVLNDDFDGLITHQFFCQGVYQDENY